MLPVTLIRNGIAYAGRRKRSITAHQALSMTFLRAPLLGSVREARDGGLWLTAAPRGYFQQLDKQMARVIAKPRGEC